MRPFVFVLLLGLAATPFQTRAVQAQSGGEVTFVSCENGAGCRCALSGLDAKSAADLLNNQEPPENADKLIILTDGVETKWSTLSPDDADATYGGDGVCPIEVFDPVLPEDGMWVGTVRTTSIEGCHEQVAAMVPGMVSQLVFSRHIAWDNRFHPAKLSQDPNSNVVTWQELTPVLFKGQMNPMGDQSVLSVTGDLTSSLVAKDEATAMLRLRIGAQGANAKALAALGMADCLTTAVYDFTRTGP